MSEKLQPLREFLERMGARPLEGRPLGTRRFCAVDRRPSDAANLLPESGS